MQKISSNIDVYHCIHNNYLTKEINVAKIFSTKKDPKECYVEKHLHQ